LTSIKGSLGLIEAGAVGELPPELKTMVDIAFKNSERLVRLINDILDIEKIEAGKMEFRMEVHNLSALISSAIDTNAAFADQYGVTLELSEVVPQDRIYGDTDRLQQVFANLLSNAVKFSPKGGNVEIAVSRVNTGFRIAVHDDGPGIPDEYREQIFEKFSQVDSSDSRKKGGTGLGLNIARTIVETHKGKLYFESNPGEGTNFFVDLPEWRSDAAGTDFPERKAKGPKILVCEDEPDLAALLSFILRTGGYQPLVAHTAIEAKHMLTEHRFRAMTLDINLPDQDGISLFRELRGKPETRDLPIIVISAMPDEGVNRLNGDAIGLIDWLVKPIDQNKLALSLDKAMNFVGGMPSILHVEDDPDVRQVVSSVLDGMANVTPVSGVMEAAAALKKDHFDLVILDLGLPDGAGEDLLPLLRREDQTSIPVVVFSVDEISSVMAKRVSASLVKSRTTNETLLKTIRSTIDGYSPQRISEEILS
ncbi:MAG: response regulator, partial [Rhodospirillales bacterium]|nr:response regulator [Rhodospirillales bacterium]